MGQHESPLTGVDPLAGSTAQVSRHLKVLQLRAELPKSTVISKLVLGKSTPVDAVAPDEFPVVTVALLLLLSLLLSPKLLVPPPKDPSAAQHATIIREPMNGLRATLRGTPGNWHVSVEGPADYEAWLSCSARRYQCLGSNSSSSGGNVKRCCRRQATSATFGLRAAAEAASCLWCQITAAV